jgi:hypothetical protein
MQFRALEAHNVLQHAIAAVPRRVGTLWERVREQLPSLLLLLLSSSPQSAMKKGISRYTELNITLHVIEHYITENYITWN